MALATNHRHPSPKQRPLGTIRPGVAPLPSRSPAVRVGIIDGDADFAEILGEQLGGCADLVVVEAGPAVDVMVVHCRQPGQLRDLDYPALRLSHPETAIVVLTG